MIRILVGVVAVPLLLLIVAAGGNVLLGFSLLVAVLALWEFFDMFSKKGLSPQRIAVIVISVAGIILFKYEGEIYLVAALLLTFTVSALLNTLKKGVHDPLNAAIDLLGFVYIAVPMALLNTMAGTEGLNYAMAVLLIIWSSDTFAYFGGKLLGKTPLSDVSPNKTAEGSAAGLIFSVITALLISSFVPEIFGTVKAAAFGLVTGIFAQAGDLFESMIKRYCGVKDSSALIPGHGGVLDRFDSLLFALPPAYVFIKLFGML